MFTKDDVVVLQTPKVPNGVEGVIEAVWYQVRYGSEVALLPASHVVAPTVVTPTVVVEKVKLEKAAPEPEVEDTDSTETVVEQVPVGAFETKMLEAIAAVSAGEAEVIETPVPVVLEFEVSIDQVDHICYTLQDGADSISVIRPKRKGRPSYKKAEIEITPPEGATQVKLTELPEMARKVFTEAGVAV